MGFNAKLKDGSVVQIAHSDYLNGEKVYRGVDGCVYVPVTGKSNILVLKDQVEDIIETVEDILDDPKGAVEELVDELTNDEDDEPAEVESEDKTDEDIAGSPEVPPAA